MNNCKYFLLLIWIFLLSSRLPAQNNYSRQYYSDEESIKSRIDFISGMEIESSTKLKPMDVQFIPDTVYSRFVDDSLRFTYSYDISSGSFVEIQQKYDGGGWVNLSRYTVENSPSGKIQTTEIWNGGSWENYTRLTEEYNGSTIILYDEFYAAGKWQINLKFTQEFDNELRTSFLREYFDNGQPVLRLLETFTYYASGLMKTFLLQAEENGNWINNNRGEWFRDDEGNAYEYHYKIWQNNTWKDSSKVYSYFSGINRDTLSISTLNDNGSWINFMKHEKSFDNKGNVKTHAYYKWTTNWNKWISFIWTYDNFRQITSEIYRRANGNDWQNYWRINNRYVDSAKIEDHFYELWQNNNWVNNVHQYGVYDQYKNLNEFYSYQWINNGWTEYTSQVLITDPFGNTIMYPGCRIYLNYKSITGINDETIPGEFILYENYPDPFNPSTTIKISLAGAGFTSLMVYDLLGRKIKVLHNDMLNGGVHHFIWNGKDEQNNTCASGIYFIQAIHKNISLTRKMVLTK